MAKHKNSKKSGSAKPKAKPDVVKKGAGGGMKLLFKNAFGKVTFFKVATIGLLGFNAYLNMDWDSDDESGDEEE